MTVVPLATIPVTLFPDTVTFPFIVNELPVPVTRIPVELSPETSTEGAGSPAGIVPTVPVEPEFKNTPILLVFPVPTTLILPLFSTTALFIPTIPTPFLISVLLIFLVFTNLDPLANIPIA